MPLRKHSKALERIYSRYSHRAFIHPDPLEFVYRYESDADREVVGLIASSLAYGRVAQILRSVDRVLSMLSPTPAPIPGGEGVVAAAPALRTPNVADIVTSRRRSWSRESGPTSRRSWPMSRESRCA